jgi:hypothetical protein
MHWLRTCWGCGRKKDMNKDHPIMLQPIEDVGASKEFVEMCNLNEFKTISAILKLQAHEMLKKPLFNVRLLMELYRILKSYNLEKNIKE